MAVFVAVRVELFVGVEVAVLTGLLVAVFEGVEVRVRVGVLLAVLVIRGVLVGVAGRAGRPYSRCSS